MSLIHVNNNSVENIQSKIIDFLRLPLVIAVLFIHDTTSVVLVNGKYFGSEAEMPFFQYFSCFFSEVIGRIAVPLFFFISGFLFFQNIQIFNLQVYKSKLKTRLKTLLVPYLFWNFIVIALFFMLQNIPFLKGFANRELILNDFFSFFWDNQGEVFSSKMQGFPISYQFWFIRDLMVVVLLTPFIYLLNRYSKFYGIILLGILFIMDWWFSLTGFSIVGIFFFSSGAYFGINKRNLLADFAIIKNYSFVLYPLFAFADMLTKKYDFNSYIHNIGILIGIVFIFNITTILFEKRKIKSVPFLSAASFFVFAIHEPFLMKTFFKISFMILQPESDLLITALYFLKVPFVVITALGIYWILKKKFPRFTAIIIGGR